LIESKCERSVRLKIDVGRENLAEACNTELTCVEIGCEKDECKIGVLDCSQIGHDGRLIPACEGTVIFIGVKKGHDFRHSKGGFIGVLFKFASARAGAAHTIIVRVVLCANRRLQRRKREEDLIDRANSLNGTSG